MGIVSFVKKHLGFFILLGTFVLFSLLAVVITYPLIFHLGDLVTNFGDELVISWIQNWVIHALVTNPLHLFNATILFPYHNTLALSDIFLTSSILAIPALVLIGQPIATFNFTFISSLALLGFSIFLLSYYLRRDYLASLFSGVVVMFAPAVLDKKIHLQILALGGIPLSILFFLMFMKSKQTRYLLLCCLFFLAQTYNSFLPGYFLLVFYCFYLFFQWIYDKRALSVLLLKKHIGICVVTGILLVPIALPYFQLSHEFHAVRDIRDTIHFALQPEDLLYGNDQTRLQPVFQSLLNSQHYPANAEIHTGYLGVVFTLLALSTLLFALSNVKRTSKVFNTFVVTGVFGLILSFGPFLHIARLTIHKPFPIPLPYLLFYYLAPGFQGFRNSARWEMLFVLCMAVAIGLLLNQLFLRRKPWKKVLCYAVLFAGVLAEFNFPIQYIPVPQEKNFPPVYHWLSSTDKTTSVLFLPIYNWNSPYAGDEILREYFMTENFRPMVNGYSGYSPIPWQKFIKDMDNFPSEATLAEINQKGVTDIIIEKEKYDRDHQTHQSTLDGEQIITQLLKNPSVAFVKQVGSAYVFSLKKP